MIDLNRTIKYFARIFNFIIESETVHQNNIQYKILDKTDIVYVSIYTNKTVLVQGKDSYIKQVFLVWANDDSRIKSDEGFGTTIFSQEWREWNEDARYLNEHIVKYGIPEDDNIPDDYRFMRDRMFHDYMFRTEMSATIDKAKCIMFITNWFDKNCFMNIPEKQFIDYLVERVFQYIEPDDNTWEFEVVATALVDTMAHCCSKKTIKGCKGCPQTRDDNIGCVLNLVDSLYPYTNAKKVVAFTKHNFQSLLKRSRSDITWKSIDPTTPIEVKMDEALKNANIAVLPQFQAYDSIHKYRVDFLLPTNTVYKIAVECDGLQYHAKPSQYILDRQRDRYLQEKNILLMRFSSVEIFNDIDKCITEIDKQFWKIKNDLFDVKDKLRISYFGI